MLYRVGTIVVYGGPVDPRLSMRVWRVSDVARMGRVTEWEGVRSYDPSTILSPREWLLEALEQAPRRE